jgi:hypothetical protein
VREHVCVDEAQQDSGHPESSQPKGRRVGEPGAFCHLVTPSDRIARYAVHTPQQAASTNMIGIF